MSIIHLSRNFTFHIKTKHIQLRYHFIHTLLDGEQISLMKIHTTNNPTDMLTKAATQEKLKLCLALVAIQED